MRKLINCGINKSKVQLIYVTFNKLGIAYIYFCCIKNILVNL